MDKSKIEGIVLRKTVVNDHDLMISVLARSGSLFTIYAYGAQSFHQGKAALLELGMMNRYIVQRRRRRMVLSSVEQIWFHDKIRFDFSIFSALALICEISLKIICTEEDVEEGEGRAELFMIVSNAIYFLNKIKNEQIMNLMALFLLKLIRYQGIFFNLEQGIFSEKPITSGPIRLNFAEGGFEILEDCCGENQEDDFALWQYITQMYGRPFKELTWPYTISSAQFYKLLLFLCYHSNYQIDKLNGLKIFLKIF